MNREGLARWMASFTDLAAIVVIREPKSRLWKRIRREIKRIGILRFVDVLAFRLYSRLALRGKDERWTEQTLRELQQRYAEIPASTQILVTDTPNSAETQRLLEAVHPDIIVARCKHLLNQRIFTQARIGTFVMHPGVCPEYRNAHGCFWALANRDTGNVGMTLLKIDTGVDTGPVYGYYRCNYDELAESHNIIQARVVFDNLDALRDKFGELIAGTAVRINTTGRQSRAWGQPWLTAYLRWKRMARADRRR
ncbi:MAG TPA: formyltransferase family protein [Candidatus Angelobacter sp.]|nr:formyltransferase family protein [Candidatus Angelobacter sp.]